MFERMFESESYPFSVESLRPALLAAREVGADGDTAFCVVAVTAPHVGAAALLDFADELSPVGDEEPCPWEPTWEDWSYAQRLRVRAARMVSWDGVAVCEVA